MGKSPWFYTTAILAALVVGAFAQNTMLIQTIASGSTDKVIIQQPSQAAPSGDYNSPSPQPTQPPATSISFGDAPVKGDSDAPITIVEFSDFECPFCGRFYTSTLPSIERDYIETGKARLIYKHFPLSFHPSAEPAAIASECANEQGKFWEMHDLIFDNQGLLSTNPYSGWAKDLGLNAGQFDQCMSSKKYRNKVQADFSQGAAAGVSGTPTFFICRGEGNCREIVGAQPYSAFTPILDSL